jgi:hypothetical protein
MTNQWKQTTIPLRVENAPAARWPKHIKARHRIQHAFHNWYRVNQSRFLVELDFIRRSHRVMEFGFAGVVRRITVHLRRNGDLDVIVWWPEDDRKGEALDMLAWYDSAPKRVPGGYICQWCNPETRLTLPSREAIWQNDLFELLLKWVNECLAPATELQCNVNEYGSSYATLMPEPTNIKCRT